tara:strand:+ start:9972 stop:11099 length:1128 start_codon:yes stop_codon:yes gene_type:complete
LNIVYFLTYGYSLKTWSDSSALEREAKYFNYLSEKYNFKFIIFTYGDKEDLTYASLFNNSKIIPIYSHLNQFENSFINFLYSFLYPFKLKKLVEERNFVIKQNQLLGSWVSCIFKIITRKKLYVRTGYDMYSFSIFDKKSLIKKIAYKILTKLTLRFSDLYSVSSETDLKLLSKNFKSRKNNIYLLRNWVQGPDSVQFKNREDRVISVGRLEYQKNFSYMLSEFQNTNYKLVIYGNGTKKNVLLRDSIKNKVNLELVDSIKNDDLIKVLNKSKYFILPSHFEGNPKSLLEAMSAGCIVLASNIENHKEIIEDGVDGFLFDLDEGSLFNKFENIKTFKEENLSDISLAATLKIKNHYSIEKIATEEKDLVLGLLNG